MRAALAMAIALATSACSPAPAPTPTPEPVSPVSPEPQASADVPVAKEKDLTTPLADHWVGEWQGPEGTSLRIDKQDAGYALRITNLDGPREFHGIAAGDAIEFERDGTKESLHAGDGAATGMKWLAGKKDCLVVRSGEGYCRD